MSETTKKYVVFLVIVVVGVVADQVTKLRAVDRLATPGYDNPVELQVPESAEGDTLESYLEREFSGNTDAEIDRIIERGSVRGANGVPLPANYRLEANQPLQVRYRAVTVIDGFWEWEYAENRGAAFSFLSGSDSPWRMPFLITVSILSFGMILYFLRHVKADQRLFIFALSLIASGAVGNLIDRVRLGYVIDFILWKAEIGGEMYRWPNFNIADVCISVGAALVFILVLFGEIEEPGEEERGAGE